MAAFGITGIYAVPLLSGWLTAVLAGRLMFEIRPPLAPAAIALTGLATPLCFYSQTFWDHTLATFLATAASLILVRSRPGRAAALAIMAPLLLAAAMLRIELLAFALAAVSTWIAGVIFKVRTQPEGRTPGRQVLSPAALTLCAILALLLVIVFVAAHRPRHSEILFQLPHELRAGASKLYVLPRALRALLVNSRVSEGPLLPVQWEQAALLAVMLLPVVAIVGVAWMDALIGIPALVVLLGCAAYLTSMPPYRSLHGLVSVSPYVALAAFAWRPAWREWPLPLVTLLALTGFYLVFGLTANLLTYVNSAGTLQNSLEWGPRYLLSAYPLMVVLSLAGVHSYYHSHQAAMLRFLVVGLTLGMISVSVQLEVRGLHMLYYNRGTLARADEILRADGPVVTDLWWLPSALADLFSTHEMFLVPERSAVADWAVLAANHGVKSFWFASDEPAAPANFGSPLVRKADSVPRVFERLYLTQFVLENE